LALAGDSTMTRAFSAGLGTGRTYGPRADRCQANRGAGSERGQGGVLDRLQRGEVALVLKPGAVAVGAGVVDQVQDRPPPGRDVVRRAVDEVAVDQRHGSGAADQRLDAVLVCQPRHGVAVQLVQRIAAPLLGARLPVAGRLRGRSPWGGSGLSAVAAGASGHHLAAETP